MTTPLRTAIIGFGKIGAGYADDPVMARHIRYSTHVQVLSEHPAFDLVAVVDPSQEARDLARSRWKVEACFADTGALAELADIDLAVIATPPDDRLAAIDPLPNLKAVVVEKPLGRNLDQGAAFLRHCRFHGILVQVNLWRRADQAYRELASGDLEKHIGRPQAALGVYGNGLLNNATHMVDFAAMLLGEITMVQAIGSPRPRAGNPISGDPDQGFALQTSSGAMATWLPLDFDHYREVSMDIWGTAGRCELLLEGLVARCSPLQLNRAVEGTSEVGSDSPVPIASTVGRALWQLYDNLADALANNADLWSPGETALAAEAVIDAIHRSATRDGAMVQP